MGSFKNLKMLWPYVKKYKKYIWGHLFAGVLISVSSVVLPIISAKLVLCISNNLVRDLIFIALLYFIFEMFSSIASYIAGRLQERLYCLLITDIELTVVKDTFKLEKKEIDTHSSGVFIDRLTKDTDELSNVCGDLLYYVIQIFKSIGVLFAILIINVYIFIFFIIMLIVSYSAERAKNNSWYNLRKQYTVFEEENSGLIAETIRGMTDIKVLNVQDNLFKKLGGRLKEGNLKTDEISKKMRKYYLLSGTLRNLFSFLLIAVGVILVNLKKLTMSNLLVLYMYKEKGFYLLDYVSGLMEMMKRFKLSSERIFELTDGTFKKEKFGSVHLDKVEGKFEFRNVYFGYDKDRLVLKNMSFTINPNETVAFVGKSGSGKSTVFSLLDKLYEVNDGEILIDNHNINDLDLDSIRNNISVINQSPYIFNFSIKDNLRLVKEDASMDEIIDVCKKAQIHDYIMSLPNQYDTLTNENGVILSGGQKQRLAIARALLKGTEIILFDEATSALDNETQKEIQKAINNMKGKQTILIIAHRLSTVVDSDRIILIDDGKVIAEGSHDELLRTSDVYKNLYKQELKS